jgi:ABC-type nitrate/sulfonate/bicarbonate transport system permease component
LSNSEPLPLQSRQEQEPSGQLQLKVPSAGPSARLVYGWTTFRVWLWSPSRRSWAMSVLSLIGFLALWQLFSTFVVSSRIVPSPVLVVEAAIPMIRDGSLLDNAAISMRRVAIGFSIGAVVAIGFGILIGRIKSIKVTLNGTLQFVRFISPTALIPIAVIWFGIAETAKIFLVFWATLIFSIITIIEGAQNVPEARIQSARSFGCTRIGILFFIILPSTTPYIVASLRTALASSYMSVIPAEIIAANSGLGWLLQQATVTLDTPTIFVTLVTFGLLGFLSDLAYRRIVRRLLYRFLQS